MDSDLWASRLSAAKRQYTLRHQQNSQLDRSSFDDIDGEEEVRPDLPCPYCYEDYDIVSLCSHLEEEHPFESKVTICPICSVKVARDMLNHIKLQHGHLFKLQRHRRLRRVAIPNSQALSVVGRDLREAHLQVLLGGGGYRPSNSSPSNAATDSFISSLMLNFPTSEEEISKSVVPIAEDTSKKNVTSLHPSKSSIEFDAGERRISFVQFSHLCEEPCISFMVMLPNTIVSDLTFAGSHYKIALGNVAAYAYQTPHPNSNMSFLLSQ